MRYIAEVISYFPAISIGARLALEYVKTRTYVDPEVMVVTTPTYMVAAVLAASVHLQQGEQIMN